MNTYKYLTFIFLGSIFFTACKANHQFKLTTTPKVTLGQKATISLQEMNNKVIDSVQFFVKGKRISANGKNAEIQTYDFGVGKHNVTALVFYPKKVKKIPSLKKGKNINVNEKIRLMRDARKVTID